MTHQQGYPIPGPAQGVGPVYRPDGEKPTATVSKDVSYENVHVLPQTPQLIALLTYAALPLPIMVLNDRPPAHSH